MRVHIISLPPPSASHSSFKCPMRLRIGEQQKAAATSAARAPSQIHRRRAARPAAPKPRATSQEPRLKFRINPAARAATAAQHAGDIRPGRFCQSSSAAVARSPTISIWPAVMDPSATSRPEKSAMRGEYFAWRPARPSRS